VLCERDRAACPQRQQTALDRVAAGDDAVRVLELRPAEPKQGRAAQWRPCRLQAQPLKEVADFVAQYRQFWDASYRRLDAYLHELQHKEKHDDQQQ